MHELSIADADRARSPAPTPASGGSRRVEVKVGHLRQVVPDSLAFAFALVAEGTVAEGAELVMEEVPAAGVCRACGAESELPGFPLALRGAAGAWTSSWSAARSCSWTRLDDGGGGAAVAGVEEVDILWISEGMSCDGDSVSITAAGQPSIEDVLLGAIPGLPKVNLHNKVLSPTLGGEEFLTPFRAAARGEADAPVRARDRGLDPEREHQRRRLLDLVRQRRGDRRAADAELVDRPARAEGLGRGRDRHLRDLRRHPRDGRQPDRLHGPRRLPRLGLPLAPAGCRSSTSPAARCSRRTSWRRSSGCSTRRPASRR